VNDYNEKFLYRFYSAFHFLSKLHLLALLINKYVCMHVTITCYTFTSSISTRLVQMAVQQ